MRDRCITHITLTELSFNLRYSVRTKRHEGHVSRHVPQSNNILYEVKRPQLAWPPARYSRGWPALPLALMT